MAPRTNNQKNGLAPERQNQLLERVVTIYERNFTEYPEGKDYLKSKGITDAALYSKYRIGYCNGRLNEILPKDSDLRADLKRLGILTKNDGEYFVGCVMFPVHDVEGNIVTLYGRHIDDPTTTIWKGSMKRHLFLPRRPKGLWKAGIVKTYSEIILADSILDALSLEIAGYANVVSVQGGNGFTDADLKVFEEYGVQRILCLPDDCDPNKILVEDGAAKLAEVAHASLAPVMGPKAGSLVTNTQTPAAEPTAGFNVTYGMHRYRIMGVEKGQRKLKATIRLEFAGRMYVDTLDLYCARSRKLFCQDICRIFEEPHDIIEAEITRLIQECEKYETPEQTEQASDGGIVVTGKDREDAEMFGRCPDIIDRILSDFEKSGLVGEKANKLLCYLAMTSRKMDEPLAVLILSGSGAGKTFLQDAAIAFCPEEDVVRLTNVSGKALFYKKQLSLKHKVLALEEREGVEDADYAIRNLITARQLISESTIKDNATGRLTTMANRVEGPTTVLLTTTDPMIQPETRSRFFVTSLDESREQTKAILEYQRRKYTLDGLHGTLEMQAIFRKHWNFQRLLKPLAVVNPYAGKLTYTDERLQSRRDQPKYLNLIKAVAFLRQMNKPIKQEHWQAEVSNYIEVDIEDIKIANQLAQEILGRSLDDLSMPGRELLMLLDSMFAESVKQNADKPQKEFSRRDVREFTGWSNYQTHIHLKELVDLEYVIVVAGRNGLPYRYRLAYDGQGKQGGKFVLGLKPIEELLKCG